MPSSSPNALSRSMIDEVVSRDAPTAISERSAAKHWLLIRSTQTALVAIVLAGWQWIPPWLVRHGILLLNPVFVASPSRIFNQLASMVAGSDAQGFYPPLGDTLVSTFAAIGIGFGLGYLAALVLAEWRTGDEVFAPFILMFNGIPRIIIFPILILILGFGLWPKIIGGVTVSFFLVYYNAYGGARDVETTLKRTVSVLGGGVLQRLVYVTGPNALAYVVVALPNIVSFTLVAVITSEVLGGNTGLGYLLIGALNSLDAPLLFSIGILSSVVSLILVGLTHLAQRYWLSWLPSVQRDER